QRGYPRRERFGRGQVRRRGHPLGMTEADPALEHLPLLAGGEIREARRRGGAAEGIEAIAVHAREADERPCQVLAAHALHRIAPDTLDASNEWHGGLLHRESGARLQSGHCQAALKCGPTAVAISSSAPRSS